MNILYIQVDVLSFFEYNVVVLVRFLNISSGNEAVWFVEVGSSIKKIRKCRIIISFEVNDRIHIYPGCAIKISLRISC